MVTTILLNAFIFFIFSTYIGCFYKNPSKFELSLVLFTFYNVKMGWRVKKGIKFTLSVKNEFIKFREITNFLPVKCEMTVFPLVKRDPNPPPLYHPHTSILLKTLSFDLLYYLLSIPRQPSNKTIIFLQDNLWYSFYQNVLFQFFYKTLIAPKLVKFHICLL